MTAFGDHLGALKALAGELDIPFECYDAHLTPEQLQDGATNPLGPVPRGSRRRRFSSDGQGFRQSTPRPRARRSSSRRSGSRLRAGGEFWMVWRWLVAT